MRRIRYCYKRNRGMWGLAFPHEWRVEIDPALDLAGLPWLGSHAPEAQDAAARITNGEGICTGT